MSSTLHIASRPGQWTLEAQPSAPLGEIALDSGETNAANFEPVFDLKPICEYKATEIKLPEYNSLGFAPTGYTSSGFQNIPGYPEKSAISTAEEYNSLDNGMARSIVKIEARFENKLTGHSIWKTGTGLLFSPDIVVAGSEVVYDAEYQLGAATQVKCYIGHRGRNSGEIQPRYGQRVVFSAQWTEGFNNRSRDIAFIKVAQPFAASQPIPEEQPKAAVVTCCSNCTGHQEPAPAPEPEPAPEPVAEPEPVPEPVAEPVPEPVDEPVPAPITETAAEPTIEPEPVSEPVAEPVPEPVVVPEPVPELILEPVAEPQSDSEFVEVEVEPEEVNITDPFYETLKTVSQIDTKTLDIESSLIDDVGQFISVAAGSLVSYVVGAETISSGAAAKLPGVPERALLAEASLQAVLAIEQSDELDEIIESMKANWTANSPEIDQLSELLAPYLAEAAKHIIEYHEEDQTSQVSAKPLKRRNLGIRHFTYNETTKAFVKALFEPTLPLAGREDVFSSLGPVLRSAVSALGDIVNQAGKTTIATLVPKLLQKYQGARASAGDIQATRVLVQRAIMADTAYQAISTLPTEKLHALKVIPLDGNSPEGETLFDFIKRDLQILGPVSLHDAKQAVNKFIPLLLDPATQAPKAAAPAPAKAASNKLALRDFLSNKKGSVKTL